MSERTVVVPRGFEAMYENWHFAQAVREGDTLWCSGQLGVGPDGKCPDDPKAQFRLAFEGLGRVLAEGGASFADVVEITTFHVGLRQHLAAFSAVKDDFVKKPYPAWTAIGVTELAIPGALVEIRAIAKLR
jgi:enamine deaminase RidA (YjgF/YER057c/UK114 family)